MILKLLKITIFLEGLVSTISIISFKGFLLVHVFLVISIILSFIYISISKKLGSLNNDWLLMISLAILFYAATLIGSVNSNILSGLISSQVFLLTFFSIVLYYILDSDLKFILIFIKGFIYSAIIESLYAFIDVLYFYLSSNHKSLNVLIPKYLTLKSNDHPLTNFVNYGHLLLYRSSGLSWDPGMIFTAVVLAFILLNENLISIKHKKIFLIIMFVAVIISISRVAIVALFIYFIIKIFKNKNLIIKRRKIKILNFLPIFSVFFLFIIGFFTPYLNYTNKLLTAGNERHLKYFSSIIDYYKANVFQILFGFGYKGAGVFFNKYVIWRYAVYHIYYNANIGNFGPPSILTDLFLFGGLIGIIFWLYSYFFTFFYGNNEIKLIMVVLIFIMFAAAIGSVWFNSIYISLFSMSYHYKNKRDKLNIYKS